MNNAYMGLGNIVGPALVGSLFDIHIDLPYAFGSFIILISLLLSFLVACKEEIFSYSKPKLYGL